MAEGGNQLLISSREKKHIPQAVPLVPLAVTCGYSAKGRLRAATHSDALGACFAISCFFLLFLLVLLGEFSKAAN